VVTRDGGVPLLSHAYPGNKPDVTQFPEMITTLAARHAALAAAAGQDGTEMTVVFDAGQNSEASFALLAGTNLHYVGSVRQACSRSERVHVLKATNAQRFGSSIGSSHRGAWLL
jgi:transposase